MPDQTYPRLSPNAQTTAIEPDQVTGVPTQADEVNRKEVLAEPGYGTTIIGGFVSNQDYTLTSPAPSA